MVLVWALNAKDFEVGDFQTSRVFFASHLSIHESWSVEDSSNGLSNEVEAALDGSTY